MVGYIGFLTQPRPAIATGNLIGKRAELELINVPVFLFLAGCLDSILLSIQLLLPFKVVQLLS